MEEPFPLIRIQFEGMKRIIMTHLQTDSVVLEQALDQAIELAIKEFDFNNVVRQVVHRSVTQAINDYFEFGEGGDAIAAVVSDTVGRVIVKEG